MLALTREDLAVIRRHAGQAYPDECCGLLLGEAVGGGAVRRGARVTAVLPASNVHPEPRHGFDVDARALLCGHRRAREEGREVIGYYHSHPDAAARPSRRDRDAALPLASYLIVGVAAGEPGEARSFRRDEAGELVEEVVQVVGS